MDCNFLFIIFKSEDWNNDMWHFIDVHSTENVYNQVILGDCEKDNYFLSFYTHRNGIQEYRDLICPTGQTKPNLIKFTQNSSLFNVILNSLGCYLAISGLDKFYWTYYNQFDYLLPNLSIFILILFHFVLVWHGI